MSLPNDKWFVEEFHLRSPIEEFEEHARFELQRMVDTHHPHEPAFRGAIELVTQRLAGAFGNNQSANLADRNGGTP
ncbi:MAG: hypothetical protein ACYTHJ_19275 [Planctomycetota bacterium]|jgi:hypothetical protein